MASSDWLRTDEKSGATIVYIDFDAWRQAPPSEANLRKVFWPDGSMAFQEWPQDGVGEDEAPEPE